MQVCKIDPIRDHRWLELVSRHPGASVFHTPGWLAALQQTYGYEPVALAALSPAGKVSGGVVFCRVSSWLTGRRLVSLPFSDHCEPLVDSNDEIGCILTGLRDEMVPGGCRYIEIRPAEVDLSSFAGLSGSKTFSWHRLDLAPSLQSLFQSFHKDCVQRRIRHAEREGLIYEEGRSEKLLRKFYRLLVLTRRRQLLPPQPLQWFRNLIDCLGDSVKIRLATKDGRPVASILTLRYKDRLVYKYGGSDRRLSNLGGTQLLLWKATEEAKNDGLREFDMGRSDWDNPGLIKFKDRWGASRSTLRYWRQGELSAGHASLSPTSPRARRVFQIVPPRVLGAVGALAYRHLG